MTTYGMQVMKMFFIPFIGILKIVLKVSSIYIPESSIFYLRDIEILGWCPVWTVAP